MIPTTSTIQPTRMQLQILPSTRSLLPSNSQPSEIHVVSPKAPVDSDSP